MSSKKRLAISSQTAIRVFNKFGYKVVRRTKHINLSNGEHNVALPGTKYVNTMLLLRILKNCGISYEDFKQHI